MKIKVFLIFIFLTFILTPHRVTAGKRDQKVKFTKDHITKIDRIANFISVELNNRYIKEIEIADFTDFNGRQLRIGKEMSGRLREIMSKKGFSINKNAVVLVTGKMANFKDQPKRWKVDIRVQSKEGKIITSYTAIFNF